MNKIKTESRVAFKKSPLSYSVFLAVLLSTFSVNADERFSLKNGLEEVKTSTGFSVMAVVHELVNFNDDRLLESVEGGLAGNKDQLTNLLLDLGVDVEEKEVSGLLKSGIKITEHSWDATVGTVFRVLTYPVRKDKKLRDAFRFGKKSGKELGSETLNFTKGPVILVKDVMIFSLYNGVFAVKIAGSSLDSASYYVKKASKNGTETKYLRKGIRMVPQSE